MGVLALSLTIFFLGALAEGLVFFLMVLGDRPAMMVGGDGYQRTIAFGTSCLLSKHGHTLACFCSINTSVNDAFHHT